MKGLKVITPILSLAAIVAFILVPTGGITETGDPIFKNYQIVEVQKFEVPPTIPAPDSAGRTIADEIVYQIRRYSYKYNLFDMVVMEGTKEIPPDKKVLLVKGTVKAYSPRGTCAVDCQFVDKASGHVLHETEAKGLIFRVGEYIAKVVYIYKVGNK